jgi:hypothetical protein
MIKTINTEGKRWLLNLLKQKIDECCRFESEASLKGDFDRSTRLTEAYFKMLKQVCSITRG